MKYSMPDVLGGYKLDFNLGECSFFKTGGNCDIFFTPKDAEDLAFFMKNKQHDMPVICLGNMSNTLILDDGVPGCVINLEHFKELKFFDGVVEVGAGFSLAKFILESVKKNISCCEMLFSIPGTVGGAIFMNAGIPDFDISMVIDKVSCVSPFGEIVSFSKDKLNMKYRNGNIPKGFIVTSAIFNSFKTNKDLSQTIKEIMLKRKKTQPIGEKTCGSTFKNPKGLKAWQLIKEAGCADFSVNDACLSDIHCNFIINKGRASSNDILTLILNIKERVFEKTGILLEEEIKIIGGGENILKKSFCERA